MIDVHDLLRRLASGDERSLRLVLAPAAEHGAHGMGDLQAEIMLLDRPTRALVRLAALLAVDAPTASLQWAVERAMASGVTDAGVAAVLLSTAPTTGEAQMSVNVSRLALALGFDVAADA